MSETHGAKGVVRIMVLQCGTSWQGKWIGSVQCSPASSLLLWDNNVVDDNSSNR